HHGIDAVEVGRDDGLCASAIIEDATWVVEDATVHPRALANPLVAGELGLRFYAGAPLRTHDGYNLGTLCVIDLVPRTFSREQAKVLEGLADIVVQELEFRLAARRAMQALRDGPDRTDGPEAVALRDGVITERERMVLEAVSEGLTNREIAARLSVSQSTVKSHVRNILDKLGLPNRAGAAAYAARGGTAAGESQTRSDNLYAAHQENGSGTS
ncbi:MAG: LuxR C-terminal-related transcriptional regulator, partial [Candidatus Limnocylindrales bacterium]